MNSSSPKKVLTCGFVRAALSGKTKLVANKFEPERVLAGVSTDSRTVGTNDLFVALKGETFDGHDFIQTAVERGCRAVLCERYPAVSTQDGIDIFVVEDTLEAFRLLSRHWREFIDPTVIAVAGSVGKTTTKDILTAILRIKGESKVLCTKGSQNGFVGIPMTLMALNEGHEVAVIEVGIDAPGAMIQHIDIVRPDFAVVTAISEEHLEWLKDLKTIAFEENLILRETAQAGGVAVINLDDQWISPLSEEIQSQTKISFTLGGSAGTAVLSGKILEDNEIEMSGLGQRPFILKTPLPGKHNARNLLAAVSIALALGHRPEDLRQGLKGLALSGGRSELQKAASGATVLCDFYNANPASMRAAIEVAKERCSPKGTLWLCLGDMKELGGAEEALHRGLAGSIKDVSQRASVLLLGERMLWLKDELEGQGMTGKVWHFLTIANLSEHLKGSLKSDDFVVIKGSNSMKMGQVWEFIR